MTNESQNWFAPEWTAEERRDQAYIRGRDYLEVALTVSPLPLTEEQRAYLVALINAHSLAERPITCGEGRQP